jgi:hypothetical protein
MNDIKPKLKFVSQLESYKGADQSCQASRIVRDSQYVKYKAVSRIQLKRDVKIPVFALQSKFNFTRQNVE